MPTISETPHKVTTIIKRDGSKQPYDYEKVINAIRQAFKATRPLMEEDKLESDTLMVANCASVLIHGTATSDTRHTEEVQDIIEEVLMEFGAHDVAKAFILYREEHRNLRAGKIATDIVGTYLDKSDWRVQENSNSGYCYASLMNHAAGTVIANYCLENVYTRDVANAHIDGDIHLHDLSAGVVGYCAGHSLRDLLMKGFIGKYGRANAGPAKHLDTALLQAANFLCTLQTEWAGAQAFNSFDTFMAPFVRNDNLDYEQVKQRMQQFVFGLNIASRYGQCVTMSTKLLKADGTVAGYDDLNIGDEIITFDVDTGKLKTDTITHLTKKPHKGTAHRYTWAGNSTRRVEFIVTPEHRMVHCVKGKYYIAKSEELFNTHEFISIPEASLYPGALSHQGKEDFIDYIGITDLPSPYIASEVDIDEDVWCPTTNTGTFVAYVDGALVVVGNCPFTNLTFDLSCPEDMKDQPVIIGGVLQDNTYGNYQKEMDMINKAFIEVMMNGDHDGRIFSFPIPTYNITKDFPWDSAVAKLLFKMTGKLGAPYFQNFIGSDLEPSSIRAMCCRLRLSLDDIRKHTGGLFGAGDQTGSIGVASINIPRIAYLAAKTDDPKDTFYKLLDNRLNLCKKALEAKRREINKNFDNGLMPYTAEYLPKKFTRHFSTIGVIGFNEACRMLFNKTIADKECIDFTLEAMHYILDKCTKFTEETGNMYNFEAVPGESCLDIDTPIQTVSGSKTIRQILEEQERTGAKTPVLSYNTETNKVEVKQAFAFLSNESAKVMKVTFDNGREVICNPKHPFGKRCFNGKNMYIDWVAASDLKVGDRIKSNNMSKKVYKDGSFYWKINNHTTLHRLAAECKFGRKLNKDEVVHHLDGNKQNNSFDNIILMSDEEHRRLHLEKNKQDRPEVYLVGSGDKNHFYGKHHSEETKKLISEKNKGKNTGDLNPARRPEVRAKLSEIAKNKPSERCSNYIADIDNDLIVNMYMSGKQPSVIAKELGGKYTYSVVKGRLKKLHVLEPNHIVTKIEYLDEERAIYNLEVEDNHNFFVGSMEDSVLTHNTSYRFAKIDKKKYPDIITAGTDDAPYYTNSSQLPVDYTSDPFEALELQEELQSTYSSGTVLHFFIGECIDDEEVVAKFVKSVCERSKIPYFSLTPEFSICPRCGYIRGIHETCPNHC